MTATTAKLNTIPKEAFSECFQQWRHRWEKCVESQSDYFEGDQISSAPDMPVSPTPNPRPKVGYFPNRPLNSEDWSIRIIDIIVSVLRERMTLPCTDYENQNIKCLQ